MDGSFVGVKTHHASMLGYLGHLVSGSGGTLAWSRVHWYHHVWSTCLEAKDVGEALAMSMFCSHLLLVLWDPGLLSTGKESSLRPQVMELLQIEDRRLSK